MLYRICKRMIDRARLLAWRKSWISFLPPTA